MKKLSFADSHAHLNFPEFDGDIGEVARSLKENNFLVLNVGSDLPATERAIELAEKYGHMYASAGIHPHDAQSATDDSMNRVLELGRHEKVVAIGETGLDFFRNRSPKEDQKRALISHLHIARELQKPVIIHSRDAFSEILPILKGECDMKNGGVLHCFSEGPEEARLGVEAGFHISFAGNMTYPKAGKLREACKAVPPERLLVETDCPFLAPQSKRGKRNEPLYLIETAKAMADERGVTPEDIARVTRANFEKLFLKKSHAHGDEDAEIVYRIRNSLYVNVTAKCTNECTFCQRLDDPVVQGHYLGIEKDPTAQEILRAIGDSKPDEVVFCGFGEPTMRLDVVKEVSAELKKHGLKTRLNTKGHGNLINGRDIVPELVGLIDSVSVSLNAADAETYAELCRPTFGEEAFDELCSFIERSKKLLPSVSATAVNLPSGVDIEEVRKFAEEKLKVKFRLRAYDLLG
ncbi:MAG: TatD family hydrolase [Nitrospinota bacterium]